ncbi:MAG: SPOR domain-containing protein [Deltaproteobacteria bacterium]|nr:SPOR domain-containing protein [Deltaproteobacteria bacterium]
MPLQDDMKFTIGQITFFVLCLLIAGFLDFYLGARFGPELFWGIRLDQLGRQSLLPEETSNAELEALLAEEAEKTTFHEVLENNAPTVQVAELKETVPLEVPPNMIVDSIPTIPEKSLKKEEAKKPEEKKVAEVATPPEPTPDPIAQVVAEEVPVYRYTLQVGSFSDSEQAKGVKKAFISRGYSSFIKEVSIPGKGKWYRVHVGKFSSFDAALKNQSQINLNYKIMPLIVKL